MPGTGLSATVRRLIAESIDSIPELEAILLLRKTGCDWTVTDAVEGLYVSETVAAHLLATLVDKGFLVRQIVTLAGLLFMLYGLIWDSR